MSWIDYSKEKPKETGDYFVIEGWWKGKIQISKRYYICEEGCKGFNTSFEILYWTHIPKMPKELENK